MKPNPLQLELKKLDQRKQAILTQYSFGKIKNFFDLLVAVGYNEPWISNTYNKNERETKLTYPFIKEWFSDREIEIKTKHWLKENPPKQNEQAVVESPKPVLQEAQGDVKVPERSEEEIVELPECKLEKADLFWFQKKAVLNLLKGYEVI